MSVVDMLSVIGEVAFVPVVVLVALWVLFDSVAGSFFFGLIALVGALAGIWWVVGLEAIAVSVLAFERLTDRDRWRGGKPWSQRFFRRNGCVTQNPLVLCIW